MNKEGRRLPWGAGRMVCLVLCMWGIFFTDMCIVCARDESMGPLVQATTPEDEWLGLVHLGLLDVTENYNGDMSQSIRNNLPTVVQVRTGNYLGSGIILEIRENSLVIVSNRHQLAAGEFSVIKLYNGAEVSGRRIYLSDNLDVGFVLADISQLSYERRARLRCVTVRAGCNEQLQKGSSIFMVGSTDGVASNISEGMVADPWYYFEEFGSHMQYNYCKAKPGMSGGGTYDEHGHCVGMITGGHENETASLPMKSILDEWEQVSERGMSYDEN